MSFIGDFIGDVVGGITGASQAADAAEEAGRVQAGMAQKGIDEQRRQFDAMVKLMSPFVSTGTTAMGQQGDLLGLGGAAKQQAAIAGIQNDPQFQAMVRQQENAMLQNASATGGLRGGNIQAALAQFRPQMLNAQIQNRFSNLGALAGLGQASAAGQAAQGMNMAGNIGNLFGQAGAAQAGGIMAGGAVPGQVFSQLAAPVGAYFMGGMGGIGSGATSATQIASRGFP